MAIFADNASKQQVPIGPEDFSGPGMFGDLNSAKDALWGLQKQFAEKDVAGNHSIAIKGHKNVPYEWPIKVGDNKEPGIVHRINTLKSLTDAQVNVNVAFDPEDQAIIEAKEKDMVMVDFIGWLSTVIDKSTPEGLERWNKLVPFTPKHRSKT